jgi:hypothetical protein
MSEHAAAGPGAIVDTGNRGTVGRFGQKVRADIQGIVEAASAVASAVTGGACAVTPYCDVSSSDILNAIKGVKQRGVNTSASASDGLSSADVFWATKLSVDLRAFMFSKGAVGLSCTGVTSAEICSEFSARVGSSELKKKTFSEIVDAQTEVIDTRAQPIRRRLKVPVYLLPLAFPLFLCAMLPASRAILTCFSRYADAFSCLQPERPVIVRGPDAQ